MAKTYPNQQLGAGELIKNSYGKINTNSNAINADVTELYAQDADFEAQLTQIINETDLDPNKDPEVTNARDSSVFGSFDTVKLRVDNTDNKVDTIESTLLNNAGAHNSLFRDKNLGTSVTATQYANITNGTFEDMYIGDYWVVGGVNWRIAAFNYYRNTGDTLVPLNHITIVPDTQLYAHAMNATNITTGGYVGSNMYAVGLDTAKTTISGIFGTHLIKHRQILSNATASGKASGWAWFDSEIDLMNETMIYGSCVWGGSTIGGSGYNIGVGKSQLPLFALNPQSINTRQDYWLRDIVSASQITFVGSRGDAHFTNASGILGVRPVFSIS